MIAEADSLFHDKLSFLLFFQPKNKKEMKYLFKRDGFNYPVFIDEQNTIEQLNHFPEQPEYQCFLLDKDNKVLLVGNPVLNPKIWKLCKQTITGRKESEPKILLEGTVIQFDDLIMHPVAIDIKGSFLLLKNRSTDYIYDVFDLDDNKKK